MTETKIEVIKLMPKEYTKAEANAFKHGFFCGAKSEKEKLTQKAVEWLRTHSEADYFELIPDANYCGAGNINKKRMIEDFEEYLKK